jgi:hypothetical protein
VNKLLTKKNYFFSKNPLTKDFLYVKILMSRGEVNPTRQKEKKMKVYNYTQEEIAAMTAEETKKAIEQIENDPDYFSAHMADRLRGTEEKEYKENNYTLSCLRYHLSIDLNPKYWERQIQEAERKIARLEEQIANPMVTFVPANAPFERIAELKKKIEEYKTELAKLTK